MKLTVLTENAASGYFAAEHGVSYFIEHDRTLLFDTGHSDAFIRNAARLNIDLDQTNMVVLSHGHWDHGNGLKYLNMKKLICHPDVFMQRYHRNDTDNVGLDLNREQMAAHFDIIESRQPYHISDSIIFLGEIPRLNDFEAQHTDFVDAQGREDFVPDDSALAVIDNNELVVVSGCSHAGICNIVEYAKKVSGLSKVKAVIGGFHLKEIDTQTQKTIDYFQENKVPRLLPSHCTQLPALTAFYQAFKIEHVKAGMKFVF